MSQLKINCNKEIFLAYDKNDNDSEESAEAYVTPELMDLVEYLKKLTPSLSYNTKILHGVLTRAACIPKNLRGKKSFIVIEDPYNMEYVSIIESDSQSDIELADKIDAAIKHSEIFANNIEIEDIYILYGYEISTILSINEEEIDEEIVDTCQKIAVDAVLVELLNKQTEKTNE